MEEIKYGGAILAVDDMDYLLGSTEGSIINIDNLQNITPSIIEYNQLEFQDEFSRSLCTDYAPKGMYSNNSGNKLDRDTRYKLAKNRYNMPDFQPGYGGYLVEGVKNIIDTLNDGIYYRIHKSTIIELINKGYTVNIGMHVGKNLKTAYEDGTITKEEVLKIKDEYGGHSTNLIPKSSWQDSYVGIKEPSNIIQIEDLESFINAWFVYDWAYIIIPNKVIRDYFNLLLEGMNLNSAYKYFNSLKLYPREKDIFQYCLQMKYIGKLNTPELKELKF